MRNKRNSRGNKPHFGKIPSKGSYRVSRMSNSSQKERAGELSIHREGYGFVVMPDPDSSDIFVPARYIGDAMDGDIVEVRIFSSGGRRPEGRISKILERKKKLLIGRIERRHEKFWVISDDLKVRYRILIDASDLSSANDGDNVVVEITRYPAGDSPPKGIVKEVLGRRGEYKTEKLALIIRHSLPRSFPLSVEKEAERTCREIERSTLLESEDRANLLHLPFVTIDGENARDFDDAVYVERADGGYRLYVSIADVSLYVRPGSEVDQEAFRRGTSVYFPDQCIPMLPEILSNEKCSLNPDEPRATVTAELLVSNDGRVSREKFYRSLIKSRARMTYTDIRKILIDKDEQSIFKYGNLYRMISLMKDCHDSLRVARLARGSVDFDLPEADIVMGMDGGISSIVKAERHVGHMMIEEFMVVANEAVARFLTENERGCIYRVHQPPPPDKLKELSLFLYNLGYKFPFSKTVKAGHFASMIRAARGRPEERLVNHFILRSMAQAAYNSENLGHFGLASECYCHFTSPIRRYPDLEVHRLLTSAKRGIKSSRLISISETSSLNERRAMEAEREMTKLFSAFFMREKVGEEFDGIISHVTKFGFFVELMDFYVEGLVHITSLFDDQFYFDEKRMELVGKKRGSRLRIGDKVRIEVAGVDIPAREVNFELVALPV